MTVILASVLALAVGTVQPWSLTAAAQHGQGDDQQAHFNAIAERLELTVAQQETLAEPFLEAFEAMQQLHRLHDVIAAHLTEDQKDSLAQMIHDALGGRSSHEPHGQGHHDEDRH